MFVYEYPREDRSTDQFTGLAQVMVGKYDWKPGEGARSVSDVFNLIVAENGLLARTLADAPGGGRPAPITEPEKLQEALKTSYGNLQQVIAGLSDADLKAPVKVFGKNFKKEEASGISWPTNTSTWGNRLPTPARTVSFRRGRSRGTIAFPRPE